MDDDGTNGDNRYPRHENLGQEEQDDPPENLGDEDPCCPWIVNYTLQFLFNPVIGNSDDINSYY